MRKLEPTFHMKRRKSQSLVDIATIQPLTSELQDKTKRGTGTSTTKDEFTFPSSPERKVAQKTAKNESKTEAQASKKDLARTRKILKVGIYIRQERKVNLKIPLLLRKLGKQEATGSRYSDPFKVTHL